MSSSPADYITLLRMMDKMDSRRSSSSDFDFLKLLQWQERRNDAKERKEEERKKKEKEKEKTPTLTYLEAVFVAVFFSPIIGPLLWNMENFLINSTR